MSLLSSGFGGWFLCLLLVLEFLGFCGVFLWWWWSIMQLQRECLWRGQGARLTCICLHWLLRCSAGWQVDNCHQPTSHNTAAREKTPKFPQILAAFSHPCLSLLVVLFVILGSPLKLFLFRTKTFIRVTLTTGTYLTFLFPQ